MKIAIAGAGAMGCVIGAHLALAGEDVVFVDVAEATVRAIRESGLRLTRRDGSEQRIPVRATLDPATVGPVDLLVVLVKCYHTEAAVKAAVPMIAEHTRVLSLQNGWGNGKRISRLVGAERVLLGVSYHSATVLAPGWVRHVGMGPTYLGAAGRPSDPAAERVAQTLTAAGIDTVVTADVVHQIWSKLSLNVCTLPTSALARLESAQLVQSGEMLELMRTLLQETVAVAAAQGIRLDFAERWEAITQLLARCAPGAKSSMLQDVEHKRRTEIDVINGAIIEAGRESALPTPCNETLFRLVKALELTFHDSPVTPPAPSLQPLR